MQIIQDLIPRLVLMRLLFTVLILSTSSNTLANSGLENFDIVTMKNGDIQQGTVAIEYLSIDTPFARVNVPYHQLLNLKVGVIGDNRHQLKDQLITRSGEVIIGQVTNSEMTIFRVLDTTLPLSTHDIASVSFSSRGIKPTNKQQAPRTQMSDSLKTIHGDRLLGKLLNTNLILKSSSTMQLLDIKEIAYIDFDQHEDDQSVRAQVTFNNGQGRQGQLSAQTINFKTQYGQIIQLATRHLSELRFAITNVESHGVPQQKNKTTSERDIMHRWQRRPKSLFRDRMTDGILGPEMVVIPAGEYMRGDDHGDDDEKPATKVTLGTFAIGVFEITFEEYDLFCKETHCNSPDDADWGRRSRPVINVSWKDATAYIDWLSKKTRKKYRLPTDAEWEYAARAGTRSTYWWGNEIGFARANCEGCQSLWDGEKTAPTGRFRANPFGLHDTAGNVFEWVADCFHDRFSEAPADGSAIEKAGCGKRVIRGGAWSFPPKEIRSANRWRDFPSRRSDDTGFRVARDL